MLVNVDEHLSHAWPLLGTLHVFTHLAQQLKQAEISQLWVLELSLFLEPALPVTAGGCLRGWVRGPAGQLVPCTS